MKDYIQRAVLNLKFIQSCLCLRNFSQIDGNLSQAINILDAVNYHAFIATIILILF